jgi:hypothetical protein
MPQHDLASHFQKQLVASVRKTQKAHAYQQAPTYRSAETYNANPGRCGCCGSVIPAAQYQQAAKWGSSGRYSPPCNIQRSINNCSGFNFDCSQTRSDFCRSACAGSEDWGICDANCQACHLQRCRPRPKTEAVQYQQSTGTEKHPCIAWCFDPNNPDGFKRGGTPGRDPPCENCRWAPSCSMNSDANCQQRCAGVRDPTNKSLCLRECWTHWWPSCSPATRPPPQPPRAY